MSRLVSLLSRLPPPASLALIYLVFIAVGGMVLWLPISHNDTVDLWDALFTSTSAVTVTGLAVEDTGTAFTGFGQAVIAVLIQLGGLGLMTFAILLLVALGIPIGMPQRIMLREDLNQSSISNITTVGRTVLAVALVCELAGAVLLAFVFVPQFGLAEGLWHAVFHAVSAFNNAGFALFPDSLSQWVGNPVVNLVVPALFIFGGLGFVVIGEIWKIRSFARLSLHSKFMIVGTLALIGWGWLGFAVLEWTNEGTLGPLSLGDKLWASWFQAVTPRTAGFNTLDTAAMHTSTSVLTMTLMLVGGGSTSTAGGIKVTTLIVMLMATVAFFRRRTAFHAFGRSIGLRQVMKVMALTTISMLVVLSGIFLMSITNHVDFLDLAFEVTSAFGTVGMSRGLTGQLDHFGEAVLMLIMFLGRVGPLTLGFFLATRSAPRVRYPEGEIFLG